MDDHKGKVDYLIILEQKQRKERKPMSESCKQFNFRTCPLPIFLFKEYLKIFIFTGTKQSRRMSDNSNISPIPSHTGNRMHNN